MRANLNFTTKSGNSYYYSHFLNHFYLLHPFFNHLIKQKIKKVSINNSLDVLERNETKLDKGNYSQRDLKYYLKKLDYWEKNHFFDSIDNEMKNNDTRLSEKNIKHAIANLNLLSLEVTELCNLKCKYCVFGHFYNKKKDRVNKNLNFEKVKILLNYLIEFWDSTYNKSHNNMVSIGFYGGEPLLNFSLIKQTVNFIKTKKTLDKTFGFHMTTNGTLLKNNIDFLVENEFSLLISLDGDEKSNSYRVFQNDNPSFGTVLDNIDFIIKKYPDFFRKNVNFSTVLHSRNSLESLNDYFKKNFNKVPSISEIKPIGINKSKIQEFSQTYHSILKNRTQLKRNNLPFNQEIIPGDFEDKTFLMHKFSGYVFKDYYELVTQNQIMPYLPTGTCVPFSKKIFLTARGKLLPCERIDHEFSLGEVSDNEVKMDFKRIASYYNKIYDRFRNLCQKCYFHDICGQCFFYMEPKRRVAKCDYCLNVQEVSNYILQQFDDLEKDTHLYNKIMEATSI